MITIKDVFYLTRQILRYRLKHRPDQGEEAALIQSFLKYGTIYVVAAPDTSIDEWIVKSFGIATEDNSLRLYISREDAVQYAEAIKAVLPNGTVMVMKTTQAMAKSLIFDYSRKGFVNSVWLCGKSPIRAKVGVGPFTKDVKRDSPSTIMEDRGDVGQKGSTETQSDPLPTPADTPPAQQIQKESITAPAAGDASFKLVDGVRTVLNEASAAERKKVDPSGSYLNLHELMERLIHTNQIDPISLDRQFELPDGFTRKLMEDITSCEVPKEIVWKYLDYFGLSEFLYLFKGQSLEIAEELRNSPQIDPYQIKQATVKAEERFTLLKIKAGKFKKEFNIYQLTFKSELREVIVTSSTKFNMVVGKDYVLEGIEPPDTGTTSNISAKGSATGATKSALPTKDEEEAILRQMEEQQGGRAGRCGNGGRPSQSMLPQRRQPQHDSRMTGKNRYVSETPEEKLEKDTQEVLAWVIKTKKVGEREARKMMVGFDDDAEALASFAKYLKEGKADTRFARRGYTPRRLMHGLHYSPIEAYTMMAELRRKPDDTMQRLKYRETDPQYQPKKRQPEK